MYETDPIQIVRKCEEFGAELIPKDSGMILIRAHKALPETLRTALKEQKQEVLSHLRSRDFVLEEWRTAAIPEWNQTFHESVKNGDHDKAEYSWWMLEDVLHDWL